jgi:hypothetical protein
MNAPQEHFLSFPANGKVDFFSVRAKILTALLFVLLSFSLSSVPYVLAEMKLPAHRKFLGQIAAYPDQNMYFSFIRQAHDGQWLFNNRLTYQPSDRTFLNIEWLAVGKIMKIGRLSENSVYQLWRFVGAAVLIGGFSFLSSQFNLSRRRWVIALAIFSLGGGFGALAGFAAALHFIPKALMYPLAMDYVAGIHPFQQIMTNPHWSLSHGMVLIGFGLFLVSERQRSVRSACLSGLVFAASGLMRPYDLISISAIFPTFIVVEALLQGFCLRTAVRRLIPVLMAMPALAYYIWLFKFDPIFKYWSQAGNTRILPNPALYLLGFGLAGVLALARILDVKSQPLRGEERLLVVWFVAVFGLVYSGLVTPNMVFSPQLGISLLSPLVILGVSLKRYDLLARKMNLTLAPKVLLTAIGLVVAFAAGGTIAFYSLKFFSGKDATEYQAEDEELAAWKWINNHLKAEEVIMAMPGTANKLGKYTSLRVVAGNWGVTPHFEENEAKVAAFFKSNGTGPDGLPLLASLGVRYVYVGPEEREQAHRDIDYGGLLLPVFKNDLVSIYSVN